VTLNPPDVAVRDLVLGVDGDGECLDGGLIELLDVFEMEIGVLYPAGGGLVRRV